MKTTYRNYIIRYYAAGSWQAFIHEPDEPVAVKVITAPRAKDERVLLDRCRAYIDELLQGKKWLQGARRSEEASPRQKQRRT